MPPSAYEDVEELKKLSPVEIALGGAGPPPKKHVKNIAGAILGENPSEWALTAATGPFGGPAARAGLIGASALLHAPESEAVLLNLAKRVPPRFQKMFKLAEELKAGGKSASDIYEKTAGKVTMGPGGGLDAVITPTTLDLSKLSTKPRSVADVYRSNELYSAVPEYVDTKIRIAKSGEMPLSYGGQYSPGSNEILMNPRTAYRTTPEIAETIGHELGHGVSQATGDVSRLGRGGNEARLELEMTIDDLERSLPNIERMNPNVAQRTRMLIQRLKAAPSNDMYMRDLGEIHGRASGGVLRYPEARLRNIEPYSLPGVSRNMGKGAMKFEPTPFSRLMSDRSPTLPTDLSEVYQKLLRGEF